MYILLKLLKYLMFDSFVRSEWRLNYLPIHSLQGLKDTTGLNYSKPSFVRLFIFPLIFDRSKTGDHRWKQMNNLRHGAQFSVLKL